MPIVLWVEDNADEVALLEQAFKVAGITVQFVLAATAIDAFWYMEKRYGHAHSPRPPDLILIDLNLPAIRGHIVLREIKSNKELHNIPTIMYSSSEDPVEIQRCMELGATAYLIKPPTMEGYAQVVRELRKHLPVTDTGTNAKVDTGTDETSRFRLKSP